MTIFNVISLLGGLALFLYGMQVMGDGLKQGSSSALKKAMGMVTNNQFMGFLLGLCVTAVIQSSTATVVLTAGLVGAGILTVHQSLGIVIGAHLGTTATGQIIRLLDLDGGGAAWIKFFQPSTLAPFAAVLGILLIKAFKSGNPKLVGAIAMGFGILFTGLLNMTAAVTPLSSSEEFTRLFTSFSDKPVLGYMLGIFSALFLHSSASVGILQALSVTGQLTFGSIYSILLGIYMGDVTITCFMVSIGAGIGARRVGIVHVLFGISKTIIILILVGILYSIGVLKPIWSVPINSGGIANANTLFNVICGLIMLPFCGIYEKIANRIVKEREEDMTGADKAAATLNKNLYNSPELALSAASEVICIMADMAQANVSRSLDVVARYDEKTISKLVRVEDDIDMLTDRVGEYLAHLSTHVRQGSETDRLNYYIKCVSEFERIGDLADNIRESAVSMADKKVKFTDAATHELNVLRQAIIEVLDHTNRAFAKNDLDEAKLVEPIEEVVDDLISILKSNHYVRIQNGECSIFTGYIFVDILTNLERVSDQCANIAVHTISLMDNDIATAEHEYIRSLHMGEDKEFNQRYAMFTERYTSQVEDLEKTGAK